MNNYHSGHFAELLALIFLFFKGYMPVRRNYVTGRGTHAGEVDLIVRKRKALIFVEVKKRSDQEQAAYAILSKQQERIRKAAEAFIAHNHQYQDFDVRFDAILVSSSLKLNHIKNAF